MIRISIWITHCQAFPLYLESSSDWLDMPCWLEAWPHRTNIQRRELEATRSSERKQASAADGFVQTGS